MMMKRSILCLLGLSLAGLSACSKTSSTTNTVTTVPAAKLVAGTYSPDSSIIGSSNLKGSVAVTQTSLYYSNVGMVRFDDPWGSKEVTVDLGSYDSTANFGPNGSMTLVAETQNYPNAGGAYPVLTSFYANTNSGKIEYVNLTSACASSGMWTCSSGNCVENSACTVQSSSAFGSRTDWDQHQVPPYGYSTTNAFPRCDSSLSPWACPGTGGLPTGHYYAKYLLLSDSGSSVASQMANLKITLSVKKDTAARNTGSTNGGINLNLILVGDQNVNDSHTVKGARNLNLLFKEVNRLFKTVSGASLGISGIKIYEWSDANGGTQYSQVNYQDLGNLFEAGSKGVDVGDSGNNINIFLVSDIGYAGANFTILGVSGAILGPSINATQTSGLAFSSFDQLATFNPNCTTNTCARTYQENDFLEMAATIVHEMGHFLGLNHPSEKPDSGGAQTHDALNDTPTCAARTSGSGSKFLDQRACYVNDTTTQAAPLSTHSCQTDCNAATNCSGGVNCYMTSTITSGAIDVDGTSGTVGLNGDMPKVFCPLVQECQFNHIMWYTTKNRQLKSGTWNEDGNLFSPRSSALLQWNSFVR